MGNWRLGARAGTAENGTARARKGEQKKEAVGLTQGKPHHEREGSRLHFRRGVRATRLGSIGDGSRTGGDHLGR